MADAQDLFELSETVLNATVEALDTLPVLGLDGAPSRRGVVPGEPAADCCPQLTVHSLSLLEVPSQPGGRHMARINQTNLIVTLFRCVPIPTMSNTQIVPPTMEAQSAAAEQIDADGWTIWNHLLEMRRQALLLEKCSEFFFDGARKLEPQGECGGWVFAFRARLDGYQEALP